MTAAEIQKMYGGSWDGGGREIHGRLPGAPGHKIELLRRQSGEWLLSVFTAGECVYSESSSELGELLSGCPSLSARLDSE